jgi:hypothetical protein
MIDEFDEELDVDRLDGAADGDGDSVPTWRPKRGMAAGDFPSHAESSSKHLAVFDAPVRFRAL